MSDDLQTSFVLSLSNRARNVLTRCAKEHGLKNISAKEISKLSLSDLKATKNCGTTTATEIVREMTRVGYTLSDLGAVAKNALPASELTLKDLFAIVSFLGRKEEEQDQFAQARKCYEFADAMLAARNATP